MQFLPISLAATDTKVYDVAGNYFEIIDAVGPITVAFYDRNGTKAKDLELGLALSGAFVQGAYSRFEITNAFGYAQSIVIMYGAGVGGSRRAPGTVRVVDGEREKVLAGNCYRAQAAQNGGAAQAMCSVMNPAGSVKNVYVQALRAGASAADTYTVIRTSSDCRTSGGILTSQTSGVNLDTSGPGSAVTLSGGNPAGGLGAFAGLQSFISGYLAASAEIVVLFPRPILLRPGFGLVFSATASATNIRSAWEWEEWPA